MTQSGDDEGAARRLGKIRDLQAAMRDYILYYLGRSLHGSGKCAEAKTVFRELVENYPDSRWASLAGAQVRADGDCPALEASSLEEPSLDCASAGDDQAQADCYFGARQYKKAKELYKRLCRSPSIACLTRLSQAAARSQDFQTAIAANESLIKNYPRTKAAEEAARKIAFLHQDAGDFESAIPSLEALLARSRARDERRHYRERIAWCRYRLGQFKEAVKAFDAALDEAETPFSLYWKARTLERIERSNEAKAILRNLVSVYGGNYYGIRAMERLGSAHKAGVSSLDPGIGWIRSRRPVEGMESADLERIHELTSIGLFADAAIEARRVRLGKGLPLPSDPRRLVKDGNGQFAFDARTPKGEIPDYPLPYADAVFSETGRRREPGLAGSRSGGSGGAAGPPAFIDPYLVYAMMRQESRYRETVVSPVGAIGLLQIMPSTGLRLAREDGWPDYQVQWLYDPLTNIELGIQYVQKLWNLLDGRWYAVVASYNAGEQVVGEWLKQRKGLTEEEFIEEIPYRETRDYVKRVYSYWNAYRSTYGVN